MSLLGPRPSSLTEGMLARRESDHAAHREGDTISLDVRWSWSRRSASRSLGIELRGDLEVVLVVRTSAIRLDAAGHAEIEACSQWQVLAGGQPIEPIAEMPPPRASLRGSVLDTPRFRHLDLRDDRGLFLRISLPLQHAAAPPVWSRIPDDLGIPGGCLSAPTLSFAEGEHPTPDRPADATARNGQHAGRAASR